MRIHLKVGTFYKLRKFLKIGIYPSNYFEDLANRTGDTYIIQFAWERMEYAPGQKGKLIQKWKLMS